MDSEYDDLAVNDKLRLLFFSRAPDDPGEAPGPVQPGLGVEAHLAVVAFQASTVAVVFDLVKPVRTSRHDIFGRRDTELSMCFGTGGIYAFASQECASQPRSRA